MTKQQAYQMVLEDMICNGPNIFCGIYDAKNGNPHFMYGVMSVMEFIAYHATDGHEWGFSEMFCKGMEISEEKVPK